MKTLTVRELHARLDVLSRETSGFRGKSGEMEVILRVQDDDGGTMVGGLTSLEVDSGCTEALALVFDGATDAESTQEIDGDEICHHPMSMRISGDAFLPVRCLECGQALY